MFKKLSDYGLMAFAALSSLVALALIYLGQTQFEEDVAAIFDNQRGKFDTTLAIRSNEYLLNSMKLLPQVHIDEVALAEAVDSLDLAYAYLNFGEYKQSYECVETSLDQITEIRETFLFNRYALLETANLWADILVCQKLVITEQSSRKNLLASEVISRSTENKRWFTGGIVLAYMIGILLWVIHERQRDNLVNTLRDKLRWQRRAETDHLTGCYNRLALEEALNDKLEDPSTLGSSTLILYDIDFFKAYNDYYGHVQGDDVLRKVVGAVESVLRAEDRQFRYGGEEFVVISENMTNDSAAQIASRALEAVRRLNIAHDSSPYGIVTISLGCYPLSSTDRSATHIIQQADKRLYDAKARGRNQYAC